MKAYTFRSASIFDPINRRIPPASVKMAMNWEVDRLPTLPLSASPRRKELLLKHGFEFEIITADIDEREIEEKYPDPVEAVQKLALAKAQAVFENNKEAVVVGADTVVVFAVVF